MAFFFLFFFCGVDLDNYSFSQPDNYAFSQPESLLLPLSEVKPMLYGGQWMGIRPMLYGG